MKETEEKLTILAQKLDENCESANVHDFVMSHRALAVLISDIIGSKLTLKIFRKIEREGGRHGIPGLTGVGGTGPKISYLKKMGLPEDWSKWQVPRS